MRTHKIGWSVISIVGIIALAGCSSNEPPASGPGDNVKTNTAATIEKGKVPAGSAPNYGDMYKKQGASTPPQYGNTAPPGPAGNAPR